MGIFFSPLNFHQGNAQCRLRTTAHLCPFHPGSHFFIPLTLLVTQFHQVPLQMEWESLEIYNGVISMSLYFSFWLERLDGSPLSMSSLHHYAEWKVLVTQLCLILCDPRDCSLEWSSPGKNTGVGSHPFLQGVFPTQGSNPGLLHFRFFSIWATKEALLSWNCHYLFYHLELLDQMYLLIILASVHAGHSLWLWSCANSTSVFLGQENVPLFSPL